jgi:hypothetical protein
MAQTLPAGPYRIVDLPGGTRLPWYIMPFDREGTCTGPLTRRHLIDEVERNDYTDLFLFSHGWNNDWQTASKRYDGFVRGYIEMLAQHHLTYPTQHRSVLVGIFWPSTALVMPWEKGPDFAAEAGTLDDEVAENCRDVDEIAADIAVRDRAEFYRLTQLESLSGADARRLAQIVSRTMNAYVDADADVGGAVARRSPKDLLDAWSRVPRRVSAPPTGEFGFADDSGASPAAPEGAFDLSDLDPRNLVRLATVLKMKDRAAKIGARGASPLLRDLLEARNSLRVHLIGHSYGSIVVLSALCYPPGEASPPMVESVLLLQPAVSQWCFAADVAGEGYAGGYRRALQQVKRPIFTTFTRQDLPLTKFFHLAARRERDLGQVEIASEGLPQPPSRFAALGGYGPAGLAAEELKVLAMSDPPTALRVPTGSASPKVCALNGDVKITGHGDISTMATWWALFQQVRSA